MNLWWNILRWSSPSTNVMFFLWFRHVPSVRPFLLWCFFHKSPEAIMVGIWLITSHFVFYHCWEISQSLYDSWVHVYHYWLLVFIPPLLFSLSLYVKIQWLIMLDPYLEIISGWNITNVQWPLNKCILHYTGWFTVVLIKGCECYLRTNQVGYPLVIKCGNGKSLIRRWKKENIIF